MPVISVALPGKRYSSPVLVSALGVGAIAANAASAHVMQTPGTLPRAKHDPFKQCVDGERTAHLVHLLSRWYWENKSRDEALLLARGWNAGNLPPLEDDKIVETVDSMLATHTRNHPDATNAVQTELTPLFDIASASVGDMLANQPQPRQWLLDRCLPLAKVGALVAAGGSGKSQWLLQLGVSVATGYPLCEHWATGEPGTALLIFAEDDRDDIHRRLSNIRDELALTIPAFDRQVTERLLIRSAVSDSNLMTKELRGGGVEPTAYVDRLLLAIGNIKDLKLIVFDPGSRFRGGSENAAEDATRFVEQLERVKAGTGATVLVAHHTHKGAGRQDEPDQNASRGSSALTDGVRWQMNLAQVPPKVQKANAISDDAHNYLFAQVTKTNYSAPQEGVILLRKEGGYLTSLRNETLEDRILAIVAREAAAGRNYNAKQIEEKFGGEDKELKAGYVKVRDAIKALKQTEQLRNVRSSGRRRGAPLEVGRDIREYVPGLFLPMPDGSMGRHKDSIDK